ncbi:hypothetical protein D3C87_1389260 [compost metagenome]
MARPDDGLQENAASAPGAGPLGQFTHRASIDRFLAHHDSQLAQLEVVGMRLGQLDLRTDQRARAQREATQPQHDHNVAGCEQVFRGGIDRLAIAQDAADHRPAAQLRLHVGHGFAVHILDDVGTSDQAGQRGKIGFFALARSHAQFFLQRLGRLPQIDAQKRRRHLTGEEHDADKADQIGQRVGRGDVGLHALYFGVGQAQVLERLGSRTHYRRFSRRPRRQARRRAGVQAKQRHRRQHDAQHQQRLDDRQGDVAQAGAVQVGEELRAA